MFTPNTAICILKIVFYQNIRQIPAIRIATKIVITAGSKVWILHLFTETESGVILKKTFIELTARQSGYLVSL